MKGVYAYSFGCQTEEGLLLAVVERDGFQASEDDRVYTLLFSERLIML